MVPGQGGATVTLWIILANGLFGWVKRVLMDMAGNCNLSICEVEEEDQEFKVILCKPGVCKVLSQK